jgi:hypothetical protein
VRDATRPGPEQHKLLGKVFHLISQPMTALQCSLEFALNTLDDPGQCRSWIEAALESSERLRCRLSLAREIGEAAETADSVDSVELRSLLQQAISEVEPPFVSGATPKLRCDEVQVSGERSRLLHAFLYLLQQLAATDEPASHIPEVLVRADPELIEVRFSGFVLRQGVSNDQVASQLEIAKEIFESAGGGMIFFCFGGNDAMVRVYLRVPQPQLDLYGDAAGKKPAQVAIGTTAVLPQVS